jgi:hypothetical protein
MLKRTVVAVAVAALSFTALAAQETATFTLRSGERLTGNLVDMSGSGFTIRVNGQERKISSGDLALIDFSNSTMSNADWNRLSGGQHVIWLRNGETLTGRLSDVSGGNPKKLTVNVNGAERSLTSNEVSRIALARPTSAVATSGSGTGATVPGGEGIAVPATQAWTPTGITVRRGETITLNTTGQIQLGPDSNDIAGPAGSTSGRRAQSVPMPQFPVGALLGRIGNGAPFAVGDQTSIPMPAAGQLFLGINDDNVSDNQGGFRVQITRRNRR